MDYEHLVPSRDSALKCAEVFAVTVWTEVHNNAITVASRNIFILYFQLTDD